MEKTLDAFMKYQVKAEERFQQRQEERWEETELEHKRRKERQHEMRMMEMLGQMLQPRPYTQSKIFRQSAQKNFRPRPLSP